MNNYKSINQIAKELNRLHSSILREIDRNKTFFKPTNWNCGNIYENPNYNPHCPKLDKSPYEAMLFLCDEHILKKLNYKNQMM